MLGNKPGVALSKKKYNNHSIVPQCLSTLPMIKICLLEQSNIADPCSNHPQQGLAECHLKYLEIVDHKQTPW